MQKITTLIASSIVIAAAAIAAPGIAQARFGAGAIADAVAGIPTAQPAQYYGGYRTYRPRSYAPRTYAPRYDNAPPYRYPGSRDALDTCAFC
jgi:hypothetical protein